MSETCPQCGATMPADAALGCCPRCALKFGLEASSGDGSAAFSDGGEGEALTESYPGGQRSRKRSPAEEDLPQPGDRFGSYQLTRVLGRGGMGMVYEADDTRTSRRVALKLLTHGWDSPEARNRFFREGRLAASINHPHSVYIYGTEEIDGTPAISMEHIAGGTLQERVREHGPLEPAEAVDAILDIVAGLEAAAAVGVLHRDVKPSNCFIDAEGTVKIGDFGLSISTTSHSDSFLTVPGAYLGTPAFSSPEQLRGDVLDVRSDIYAVGVTLFYLLTGRTPFAGDNLMTLLATVLEQPAPSPGNFREQLPSGLCKVVLRCLAKQPGDRYRDYGQLRAALVPFDSTAPTSAALALRFAAGVCDVFILSIIGLALTAALWDLARLAPGGGELARFVFGGLIAFSYYAVPEGIWGASVGKAIFGLRVVVVEGKPLGLKLAFTRAFIYFTLPNVLTWLIFAVMGNSALAPTTTTEHTILALAGFSQWVILASLFSTARRQNGYAALHDLAVGARVVLAKGRPQRPRATVEPLALPDKIPGKRVGPYHVLDTLRDQQGDELLLGYDPRLLRRVWIHRVGADADPVSNRRRNVGRAGRSRWISGHRSSDEAWDAYDSFGGQSFLEISRQPQPWETVRAWLLDSATEMSAATKDATLPSELRLDHIWITTDGRAKFLDFAAPRASDDGAPPKPDEPAESASNVGRFLKRVAVIALRGCRSSGDSSELNDVAMRLPLPASVAISLFEKTDLPEICNELEQLNNSVARITRSRRAGVWAAMLGLPLFFASALPLSLLALGAMAESRPELDELRLTFTCKQFVDRRHVGDELRAKNEAAWEVYIANRFRSTIEDKQAWGELLARTIPPQNRGYAEQAVRRHPNPTAEEIEAATALIEPELTPFIEAQRQFYQGSLQPQIVNIFFLQLTWMWVMFVSIPTLAAAILARRGVIARIFGVEYVTRRGHVASRFRLLWRAILTQTPMFALALLVAVSIRGAVFVWPAAALLAIFALLFVFPFNSRSMADRLAGTAPVPV